MTVVRVREQARLYVGPLLRNEGHHSVPLPVLQHGALAVCVMLSHAEILEPGGALSIWPPSYIALFNGSDQRVELIRSVSPRDFGRADDALRPLGSVSASERMSDEHLTSLAQVLQGIDKLCEPFARGVSLADLVTTAEANVLKTSLNRVLEPPLLPYYAAVANPFFRWLGFSPTTETADPARD